MNAASCGIFAGFWNGVATSTCIIKGKSCIMTLHNVLCGCKAFRVKIYGQTVAGRPCRRFCCLFDPSCFGGGFSNPNCASCSCALGVPDLSRGLGLRLRARVPSASSDSFVGLPLGDLSGAFNRYLVSVTGLVGYARSFVPSLASCTVVSYTFMSTQPASLLEILLALISLTLEVRHLSRDFVDLHRLVEDRLPALSAPVPRVSVFLLQGQPSPPLRPFLGHLLHPHPWSLSGLGPFVCPFLGRQPPVCPFLGLLLFFPPFGCVEPAGSLQRARSSGFCLCVFSFGLLAPSAQVIVACAEAGLLPPESVRNV